MARLAAGEVHAAAAFLRDMVWPASQGAGYPIRRITVAGGSAFKGAFARTCRELGIERYQLKPRPPRTNGFVERLQGTILTECWRPAFRRTYFVRVEDLQHVLDGYLRYSNGARRHQGYRLRGRTPAQAFYDNTSAN